MAILSGRTGTVTIGTVSVPATNVSVNSKADEIDTTNFLNQGFASHAIGMYSAEITLDVLAVDTGYGWLVGQTGSVAIGDGDPLGVSTITITNCVITSINYDANAKDVQKMSVTFATYGAFSCIVG
jgi:hypothetical protein